MFVVIFGLDVLFLVCFMFSLPLLVWLCGWILWGVCGVMVLYLFVTSGVAL